MVRAGLTEKPETEKFMVRQKRLDFSTFMENSILIVSALEL